MQLSHGLVTIILPHSLVQLSYGWKLNDDMELGRSLWFGGDHLDAFFYWTLLMNTKLLHQNERHTVEEIILHQQSMNQKNHAQYSCTCTHFHEATSIAL